MKISKNEISVSLLLIGAAVFYTCFCLETGMRTETPGIKPWRTYWCLISIADGCNRYRDQFGTWPDTLDQVVAGHPDLAETSTDAWGRAVIFVPYRASVGYGKVISYGRDGKPGGTGDDGDIEVRFLTGVHTNGDGSWPRFRTPGAQSENRRWQFARRAEP